MFCPRQGAPLERFIDRGRGDAGAESARKLIVLVNGADAGFVEYDVGFSERIEVGECGLGGGACWKS